MPDIDIVQLVKEVLDSLVTTGYERNNLISFGQLIFPLKNQANGTKIKDRISEQELRQLFIEKFKNAYRELYYSIETPTQEKYKFGKNYNEFKCCESGQSALLDMCIFNRVSDCYNRILNIEFKSNNPIENGIGKDILKLMNEQQNGVFIHLLKNTNKNTLCNGKTGVFDKLYKSLIKFNRSWYWENEKNIQLIILSLEQDTKGAKSPFLMYKKIKNSDLSDLKKLEKIFNCSDLVNEIDKDKDCNSWQKQYIKKGS